VTTFTSFEIRLNQLGVNANERVHWAARHRRNRDVRETSKAFAGAAIRWRPRDYMASKAALRYTVTWPKGKRRLNDPDNLLGQLKPVTDGIRDAGLIQDDSPRWLTLLPVEQEKGTHQLLIHVDVEITWSPLSGSEEQTRRLRERNKPAS
jgi:hypothetical protein